MSSASVYLTGEGALANTSTLTLDCHQDPSTTELEGESEGGGGGGGGGGGNDDGGEGGGGGAHVTVACGRGCEDVVGLGTGAVCGVVSPDLPFWEVVVGDGEGVYIPQGFWHYVRSLTASISVNFWWERENSRIGEQEG